MTSYGHAVPVYHGRQLRGLKTDRPDSKTPQKRAEFIVSVEEDDVLTMDTPRPQRYTIDDLNEILQTCKAILNSGDTKTYGLPNPRILLNNIRKLGRLMIRNSPARKRLYIISKFYLLKHS